MCLTAPVMKVDRLQVVEYHFFQPIRIFCIEQEASIREQLVIQLNHFAASFRPRLDTPDYCQDRRRAHKSGRFSVWQLCAEIKRKFSRRRHARNRHNLAEIAAGHAVSIQFHNFFSNPVERTTGMAGTAAWTASSADLKNSAKRIKTAAAPAAGKTHIFPHM